MTTQTHPFSHLPENHRANHRMVEPICSKLVEERNATALLALYDAVRVDTNFQDGEEEGRGQYNQQVLLRYIANFLSDLNLYPDSSTHHTSGC